MRFACSSSVQIDRERDKEVYGLAKTMGELLGTALPQIVTFAVYASLVADLCYSFRPPSHPPIALHFIGVKDLVFAVGATIVLIAACGLRMYFSVSFLEASCICSRN